MEVILLERIERLGQMGDVVVVKDGFARNFLLPKNKALRANKINLEYFEKEKINLEAKNLKLKSEAEAISDKITKDNYIVIRQASDTGQLYHEIRLKLHPDVTSSIDMYNSRSIDDAEALIRGQNTEPEQSKEEESIDLEEIFEEGALPNDSISDEVEAADNEDSKPNDSNNHNEEVVLEEEIEQQESKETDS